MDGDYYGNKKGLKSSKRKLGALADSTESEKPFYVRQPGRKYFASGQGDRLVTSVEKDYKQDDVCTRATEAAMKSSGDDDYRKGGHGEKKMEDAVGSNDPSVLVTRNGQKISWKHGNIETEEAHILVSSQGACSQAIISAGGLEMKWALVPLNIGDITVTPGFTLACSHVIHTKCSHWHGGKGEQVLRSIVQKCLQKSEELGGTSIAFPVIGAGNLNFPPDAASRIMLEQAITFCQLNPSSTVKDIRFVVFKQDAALIAAFTQEMANRQSKNKVLLAHTMVGSLPRVSKGGVSLPRFSKESHLSIEVIKGDLIQEENDAIMNIISTDMNMNNAGELSQAILAKGGPRIQQECSRHGKQTAGKAVMTGGGSLAVRHVIHIITGSSDKQHLQTCLEAGLRLADTKNLRSISIPSVGTGGYGLAAADSAQITFQALNSFSGSCKNVRKVRVVVFQDQMMQDFLQEQKRQAVQDVNEQESDSSYDQTAKMYVTGKNKARVGKTVDALKKVFSRKLKGAEEGIPLPDHWTPMPPSEKTVCTVQLVRSSSEYQDVLRKMQATVGGVHVQKIERVQNPYLYRSYMVRKQKMDKDNGGNSERQLFHGTDGKNISHINAQGFNRSFCGAHGVAYGRGVYFARDASYSVNYVGRGGGAGYMYLARVMVGTYCVGNPKMIVPPPKHPSRPEILHDSVVDQMGNPSIFVVFFDNQCYPEYLITFQLNCRPNAT